ncbi:hypothetical protein AS850_02500 [Frondihabitans sp. 762G35]|uniref:LytR C-terminal domain-containing protein n=1 Tax=Frondihabitans sp. 762G35 TaxID=1446794 RepID=UPI000D219E63|nr:LytR C-terminal domain-containing protein [Frondihabitans sp. 762G35]ARC55943.1 hypothetical protein AS850_02500 [Frondihabitans sp. 762G35]
MAKFPPDRFDGVPDSLQRVGAHRSGRRSHHGLIVFAWAALATGLLVGAGVLALNVLNNGTQFTAGGGTTTGVTSPKPSASASTPSSSSPSASSPAASSAPTPSVTPLTDPTQIDSTVTKITVLNGTTTRGLAANAATTLRNGGWVVASQGNTTSTAPSSVVYYSTTAPANQSIALGIAQKLGIASVQPSTAFPNAAVAVVLGPDYTLK